MDVIDIILTCSVEDYQGELFNEMWINHGINEDKERTFVHFKVRL